MAEGPHTGSERPGAGHSDREDGPGRCGRKPVCRLEAEKRDDTPKGRAGAMTNLKSFDGLSCFSRTAQRHFRLKQREELPQVSIAAV